jgi:hypothetical protein
MMSVSRMPKSHFHQAYKGCRVGQALQRQPFLNLARVWSSLPEIAIHSVCGEQVDDGRERSVEDRDENEEIYL